VSVIVSVIVSMVVLMVVLIVVLMVLIGGRSDCWWLVVVGFQLFEVSVTD
jgi:hypothetical protein